MGAAHARGGDEVTGDIWGDPEAQAWRERANRELRPMVEGSAVAMMLWNDEPDAKMAVELGFILLLGKPLIIMKPSGGNVPPHLAKLAQAIVEYDDLSDPTVMERVAAEAKRITEEQ